MKDISWITEYVRVKIPFSDGIEYNYVGKYEVGQYEVLPNCWFSRLLLNTKEFGVLLIRQNLIFSRWVRGS